MSFFQTAYEFVIMSVKDPGQLIQTVGYIGLIIIVFAETGLLVGFFLPGDSLLISAGLLVAKGDLSLSILIPTLIFAAIVGDATGFFIGHRLGPVLYRKKDSFFFRKKHIITAHNFYEQHGGKAIIIARFIPIIRTFAPTVAGAAKMNYSRFVFYNVSGAFLWVLSTLYVGYFLGQALGKEIDKYIQLIIVVVIFISLLPMLIKWLLSFRKPDHHV